MSLLLSLRRAANVAAGRGGSSDNESLKSLHSRDASSRGDNGNGSVGDDNSEPEPVCPAPRMSRKRTYVGHSKSVKLGILNAQRLS